MWTNFTNKKIKKFKAARYNINNNAVLLDLIKNERSKIKAFMQDNINNLTIKIKTINPIILENKIKSYISSPWVDSANIKKNLPKLNVNVLIEWKLNNLQQNMNSIYIKTTQDQYDLFINRIKNTIMIIEYLKNKTNNINKLTCCYLILTKLKKYFPKDGQIINIQHANSGYSDSLNNYIFIWRYEEYEKVLFHEMIHNLRMDHRDTIINKLDNINNMHNYFEAITDFWGIFYHIIYLSLITKVKIKSLLEIELGFIKNQAMILNNYFELNNWNKLKNENILIDTATNKQTKLINQNASAFSYYIIKYLLFKFSLTDNINNYNNYNILFKKVLEAGFINETFIPIKSSRMTLFQLK
jgi:hypothetical protein